LSRARGTMGKGRGAPGSVGGTKAGGDFLLCDLPQVEIEGLLAKSYFFRKIRKCGR